MRRLICCRLAAEVEGEEAQVDAPAGASVADAEGDELPDINFDDGML